MLPTSLLPDESDRASLLSDARMRRFVTDGYLILDSGVPAAVHEAIYRKLQWILHEEGNPGNNILPAVPEMQQILDSPTICGALTSILGPDYLLHPHRFVHNNEPGERTPEGERMGKGSQSFIGWHQDSHSPLARPRHHYARYAMLLYYPQDTPALLGPTQIIPATHLNRHITEEDKQRGFQAGGAAGTCVLVHFDLAHGGSLNLGDHTRHMAKFVFARVHEPTGPSWDCHEPGWQTPHEHQSPHESVVIWSHHWDWLCGRKPRRNGLPGIPTPPPSSLPDLLAQLDNAHPAAIRIRAMQSLAAMGAGAADAVPTLMAACKTGKNETPAESLRQNAIYTLAAIGTPAVGTLCDDLRTCEQSGWSEGAVVMEDSAYTLAAVGTPAVPALLDLAEHPNEWVQINALFALGEMGREGIHALPTVVRKLTHPSHRVVRTALDALGQIGADADTLPALQRLFAESESAWQEPLLRRWTGQDQVRFNAMQALLRLGMDSEAALQTAAEALDDPCGYVGGVASEALLRHPTPTGLRAAVRYLRAHRWDASLNRGIRTF